MMQSTLKNVQKSGKNPGKAWNFVFENHWPPCGSTVNDRISPQFRIAPPPPPPPPPLSIKPQG